MKLSVITLFILLTAHATTTEATNSTVTLCPAVRECLSTLTTDRICSDILPVPARSLLPPRRPNRFILTKFRRGVYIYDDIFYLSIILRSGTRLVMLDIPDTSSFKPDGSFTKTTDAAEQVLNGTIPTRIDIIYSHAHFDHIGGTARFVRFMKAKFPDVRVLIWGTLESQKLVQVSESGRALPPTVTVGKQGRTLVLDPNLKVSMRITGGHSQQDLLLHIPASIDGPAVVMLVDVVFPRWAPPFNFAITQDFRKYIRAHKEILKLDFSLYVGGHIRTGDRNDVKVSLRYAEDVLEAAKEGRNAITNAVAFENGAADWFDPRNRAYGNQWFTFIRVLRPLQIDVCYKILLMKWGCRIGAVDITARGHCFTALQFLQVDD